MLGEIIFAAVVIIGLCAMWIRAIRAWGIKKTNEAIWELQERTKEVPKHLAYQAIKHYEYELLKISKYACNGKVAAFEYAFKIGYLEGKGETKHE